MTAADSHSARDPADLTGRLPSGTVTFLFTDVEGSTRLWAADTDAMAASLRVHDAILRDAIESNGGYVFTTAGDSFAAAFSRASDAVTAATAVQTGLADADWPGPTLRVRIGVHLGEAEERNGDYFGPAVNTAARVEAAGHGGQTLLTDAVRATARVTAMDLGQHRLRDVSEPVRLFQLGDGSFPPLRVSDAGSSNLPVRPTRLLGREHDIATVRRMMSDSRLVTVTAAGGSGKTRLVIAVGEAELPHRDGGVWFVDLTAVARGAEVTSAIASSLGLVMDGPDRTALVIGYLADRNALVILDNCEHVIDECAEFADRFLRAAGNSSLVATSREPLDIDGERTLALLPLPSATPDSPGVRLFVDRASAVRADFALNDTNAATVAEICLRLDGLPLAIELAAARVTFMTPGELLAGLDDRFEVLSSGRRRQSQRQRTLEATIAWSYDLLDDAEQALLRALGVFVDGFDLDAVAAVARLAHRAAATGIEALLTKSLVVRAERADLARFRLLESVKAYAEDRLAETGETDAVRDRHLDHFHRLATVNGRALMGTIGVGQRLRHDTSNVSTAFDCAMATDRPMIGAELVTGSTMAYFFGSRISECRPMLDRCTDRTVDLDDELRGCVAQQTFYCHALLDDWAAVFPALAVLVKSPTPLLRALGFAGRAWTTTFTDESLAAKFLHQSDNEMETASESVGVDHRAAVDVVVSFRAWAHATHQMLHGNDRAGLAHAQSGLSAQTVVDDRNFVHLDLTAVVAGCQILTGQPDLVADTVAWLAELDLPYYDGAEVTALARLATNDLDTARKLIERHARRASSDRLSRESCDSLLLLAALAHSDGDSDLARGLMDGMGNGRHPATMRYATFLAGELGVDDPTSRGSIDPSHPDGVLGAKRALRALRTELARRNWT